MSTPPDPQRGPGHDEVPEADRLEQRQPLPPESPADAGELREDQPEGDALEQGRPGPGDVKEQPPRVDAPEGDALEQGRMGDDLPAPEA